MSQPEDIAITPDDHEEIINRVRGYIEKSQKEAPSNPDYIKWESALLDSLIGNKEKPNAELLECDTLVHLIDFLNRFRKGASNFLPDEANHTTKVMIFGWLFGDSSKSGEVKITNNYYEAAAERLTSFYLAKLCNHLGCSAPELDSPGQSRGR